MADNRERFFTNADWWMVALTLALVIVTYFSLKAINGQLEEMKAAGKQTDKMIETAVQQAQAAKTSADAAVSAADSAKRGLLLSERGWIGVTLAHLDMLMSDTAPQAKITIKNGGPGPATHVHFKSGMGPYKVGEFPKNPPYSTEKLLQSDRMLLPQDTFSVDLYGERAVPVPQLAELSDFNLKLRFYVWAEFTYQDVLGNRHSTQFCGFYHPAKPGTLITCPFYNDAN